MPATTTATPPPTSTRAFGIGIGLNIAFVAIEAFYGWKIDSLALLADAGHNLSDVIGLVLAWGGALAGRLRPDARHTYGWKRASILAAFINALLLLVAMGSLAWEAVHRLQSPQAVEGVTIMVVAGIGIVVNTATALLFMRGSKSDLNIRGAFLHMAADALVSAGVVVAGGLALWFGWTWLDPVVSLVIAAVIVVGHLEPVPAVAAPAVRRRARRRGPARGAGAAARRCPAWRRCTTCTSGPWARREIALTAHLVMPEGGGDDAFLKHATDELHEHFEIRHVTLQVVRAGLLRRLRGTSARWQRRLAAGEGGVRSKSPGPGPLTMSKTMTASMNLTPAHPRPGPLTCKSGRRLESGRASTPRDDRLDTLPPMDVRTMRPP
ncbi:MAG: cation diffusion facilitator family transporter [Desulfosudis oleivorans]|nr:cation diffusion facilitator family transporter [Desulfosudis oleivorans]